MRRPVLAVFGLLLCAMAFDEVTGGKFPNEGQCAADGCKTYFTLTSVEGGANGCGVSVAITANFDEGNENGACNCVEQTQLCGAVEQTTCTPSVDLSVTVTGSGYVICEDGSGWTGAGNTRSVTIAGSQVECNAGTGGGSFADEWAHLYVQCGTECEPPYTSGRVAFVITGHIGCAACAHLNASCAQEPI